LWAACTWNWPVEKLIVGLLVEVASPQVTVVPE
jgi:hypothetical protein